MDRKDEIIKEYGLDLSWMTSSHTLNCIKASMEKYADEKCNVFKEKHLAEREAQLIGLFRQSLIAKPVNDLQEGFNMAMKTVIESMQLRTLQE
ncbi:hypothetical protein L0152_20320 [bacterium]|nr:hypothetical protein [bacterium]